MSTTSPVSKRRIGAVVAAVATFAIVSASAATLGGLDNQSLGANSNTVVAPVENGVTLTFDTSYDAAAQAYVVTAVDLQATDPAETISDDAEIKLTLVDAADAVLVEYVSTDGGETWTDPAATVTAHDVARASVVIDGGVVAVSASEID
ncbi:hypothetical protein [Tessaracoccus lapidicaptus]|uniref:hypothetical protein n=1 Tax=Tessaracoccus lapidicaptus TaxID=1427523 RepID=UPI00333EA2E2